MIVSEHILISLGIHRQRLSSCPFYLRINQETGHFCNVRSKLKNKNRRNCKMVRVRLGLTLSKKLVESTGEVKTWHQEGVSFKCILLTDTAQAVSCFHTLGILKNCDCSDIAHNRKKLNIPHKTGPNIGPNTGVEVLFDVSVDCTKSRQAP